jgi:hypothetical protein
MRGESERGEGAQSFSFKAFKAGSRISHPDASGNESR